MQRRVSSRAESLGGPRRARPRAAPRRDLRDVGAGARALVDSAVAERDAQLPRRGTQHDRRGDRSAGARGGVRDRRGGCVPRSADLRRRGRLRRHDRSRVAGTERSSCGRSWRTGASSACARPEPRSSTAGGATRSWDRCRSTSPGTPCTSRWRTTGPAIWLQTPTDFGLVNVGAHLFDTEGRLVDFDFMRLRVQSGSEPIPPGTRLEIAADLPHLEAGNYRVEFDLVAEGVAWFSENGNPTVTIDTSSLVSAAVGAGEQVERVAGDREQHLEALARAVRGAGQVADQRLAARRRRHHATACRSPGRLRRSPGGSPRRARAPRAR